jgi:hypothetical protein
MIRIAPEMNLVRFDAAKKAIAEAARVDEIKSIRDKAIAMQVYARQANDVELICYATEIRLRAEHKAGELLAEMAKRKERDPGGHGRRIELQDATQLPTLSDLGVTKTQSSRWQALARLSEAEFEAKANRMKGAAMQATTSAPRHPKSEFTGEQDWHTPFEYINLARDVLGTIDLDPASSLAAQKTVAASSYFAPPGEAPVGQHALCADPI